MYTTRPLRSPTSIAGESIKQAHFQQKQKAEKERKLLEQLDSQQKRAMKKATISTTSTGRQSATGLPPGKVRQMFEERRKGGLVGIDKSYPLEPISIQPRPLAVVAKTPSPLGRGTTKSPVGPIRTSQNSIASGPLSPRSQSNQTPRGQTISPRGQTISPRGQTTSPRGQSTSPRGQTTSPRGQATPFPRVTTRPTQSQRTSPLSRLSRQSSSSSLRDENGNESLTPTTTKYSDYVEQREIALGTKLRQIRPPEYSPPKSPGKSMTPLKKSTTPTAKSTPSPPTSPPKRSGPPPPGLAECKICSRCFALDRIATHESICKKTKNKKVKVFNPTKMRMEGTEAEPYIRTVSAKGVEPKKVDWRRKHEEFIATIRAAKEYQKHVEGGGNPKDLPPPPPSDTSDYVPCPHCGRRFSQAAGERHIPKCKNIKSNKK